ncbi:BTAD domain-containing putative transcriptional regulator [Nonomuraea sp. NPDC049141]|uniref:AfsR/SARP family transcriptional regulator n=1 Tax=Nonomuraea sp. NPDC049141 TaxID=3155500 RepID=UPI0033E88CEB
MRVEFRLLGEVCARVDGKPVDVGPTRQRYVLTALLVEANHPVSMDRLAERVWGEDRPPQAAGTLRSYLSRLRAAVPVVEEWGIRRRSGGYLLEVDEAAVDLHLFHRLLAQARGGRDGVEPVGLYERALALWRGEAFADLDTPWLTALRHTLQAERFAAQLDCQDLRLRRGEDATLLADLAALAAVHPLDERLAGQLMIALYRSGRQADALACYTRIRRGLAEALGTDPGATLQRLHQQILSADPALAPVRVPATADVGAASRTPSMARDVASVPRTPPTPVDVALVPRTLPAAPPLFVGRARELAELDDALNVQLTTGTVRIVAVGGCGGIGKTWLALHWAHRNADAFADGQLYVNLRGFDPCDAPMSAVVAVRTLLGALGVDPAAIPPTLDAQVALYRSLVSGRRMLIVLDNARDTTQVAPLLPGNPPCFVLVTSRHELAGLMAGHGACPITLPPLGQVEARRLFTRHVGSRRAAAEPAAVAGLLELCAGLPLALSIIAARAKIRPDFPLRALAENLGRDSARLDALDAGEPAADLKAVFSWSYRTLSAPAARLFRLLGIHPGPDADEEAAASMAALDRAQARRLLTELTRAHLLIEHRPRRYTFHDLLRAYAAEQALARDTQAVRRAGSHRVLDHYVQTAHAAMLLLYPHRHPITLSAPREGVRPTVLTDPQQAMAWFTAEHAVLIAAVRQAADLGFGTLTWQLAWALVTYFDHQGHWPELLSTQQTALAAAQRLGDRLGQAHAHEGLVRVYTRLGRHDKVRAHVEQTLTLFGALGDRVGLANAHRGVASLLETHQGYQEALGHAEQARELYQQAGHRAGLAHALNAIGWYHTLLGHHDQALIHCQRALDLHRELGHQHGQATTWDSLGHAHLHLGHHAQAAACYEQALNLFREVADRYNEAATLVRLGDAHHAAGHDQPAGHAWRCALEIFDQLGHADADRIRPKIHDHLDR